jgi:hypothetical protein
MVYVLVHHKISDYPTWRGAFDAAIDFRQQGGERSCRIFRNNEDDNDLTLLFEWESGDLAHRYMHSPELQEKMKRAGVIGEAEVTYLSEMYTVRRSAAD